MLGERGCVTASNGTPGKFRGKCSRPVLDAVVIVFFGKRWSGILASRGNRPSVLPPVPFPPGQMRDDGAYWPPRVLGGATAYDGACKVLTGAADLGVAASHQVIDTPAVTAAVTQYDEHAVECARGRLHTAAPPAGASQAGTVTYGLNIQAWCVFLLAAHHLPVEPCAEIITVIRTALAGNPWMPPIPEYA
jgi:hypothetical protein